jgi:hypothetical protein
MKWILQEILQMYSVNSLLFKKLNTVILCILAAFGSIIPGLCYLASGYTIVWRDTAKLFQPMRHLINESLRSFHLPLWNPHEALGVPLLAQMMHGVLHPVSIFTAFFLPNYGLDINILMHTALAASGCTLLARVLGLSPMASAVAGLTYGLSGYLLGMGSIIQYLYGASSAPWAIAGLRMAGEGRRYWVPAAAVAVAVVFFSGDPQWAIVSVLLGLALAIEAGGRGGLLRALSGIIIGALMASVQLLPTLYFMGETSRGVNLDILDRVQWALSPWRLIEFFSPGFFGSPAAGLERWPVFVWLGGYVQSGLEMPFAPSVYIGMATILFAVAGIMRSRVTRVLAIAALILLWLALGRSLGAEQITHLVPVWGKFRYAEKMVGPFTLSVSLLAAFGVQRFSESPSRSWTVIAGVVGGISLLAATLLGAWQGFDGLFQGNDVREAAALARQNLATGLIYAGVTSLSLATILFASLKWEKARRWFTTGAAILMFTQLVVAAPFAIHGGARDMRNDAFLQRIRTKAEQTRIVTPLERNYLYPPGVDQYDAQIAVQSRLGVPCYNLSNRIDQMDTYTGLRPKRLESLLNSLQDRFGIRSVEALRRYSVTHMMIKDPYFPDELEVAKAASEGGVRLLDDRKWGVMGWSVPHRPWALFAEKTVASRGENEAMGLLMTDMGIGGNTIVLEGARLSGEPAQGRIISYERQQNQLQIEAVAGGDGVLVVNDSYWPGWKATIDGREVPVWRADYLVRAVPWPAGRHTLDMRYQPGEVRAGMILSVAGLVALLGMVIFERRKPYLPRINADNCG